VAGAHRSCGLLSPDGLLRDDGSDLQSHHGAHSRNAGSPADQSLRAAYREITASSLVKIDVEGNILAKPDTDYAINKSGYVIHGAIHKARPDVGCIIHTHTRAGMAVAAMKCGLLPMSQTSIRFEGHIGYHDYEGPAVDLAERERLVADLGPHDAMVLRNHGLLTCGPTIQQAFNTMYQLEMSCRGQVDAMAARTELTMPARTCWRIPRISISPARAGLTVCWNGPRCCDCSRPRERTRAIRRIGIRAFDERVAAAWAW